MKTIKQLKYELRAWDNIADKCLDLMCTAILASERKKYVSRYYEAVIKVLDTEQAIQNRRKTAKLRQRWLLRANAKQYQRDPIINLCEVAR